MLKNIYLHEQPSLGCHILELEVNTSLLYLDDQAGITPVHLNVCLVQAEPLREPQEEKQITQHVQVPAPRCTHL